MTREGPKISSVTREGAKINCVMLDRTSHDLSRDFLFYKGVIYLIDLRDK